jgi:hypothetical protein
VSVEAEVTSTFCYGNAGPDDVHLLADIVVVDGDIVLVKLLASKC